MLILLTLFCTLNIHNVRDIKCRREAKVTGKECDLTLQNALLCPLRMSSLWLIQKNHWELVEL